MKIYQRISFVVTRTDYKGERRPLLVNGERVEVSFRGAFLRDHHIDGKTLARLLPSWAKHKPIKSIGPQIKAFYAKNDKVICDRSGPVVGSDEWHEWQETQPDPFRATRLYRQSRGELRA